MSHFYGDLTGDRGVATRRGSKKSGIHSHIRGWNVGVKIEGDVDAQGEDSFTIYKTGGSNNPRGEADIVINKDGVHILKNGCEMINVNDIIDRQ